MPPPQPAGRAGVPEGVRRHSCLEPKGGGMRGAIGRALSKHWKRGLLWDGLAQGWAAPCVPPHALAPPLRGYSAVGPWTHAWCGLPVAGCTTGVHDQLLRGCLAPLLATLARPAPFAAGAAAHAA